MPERQGRLSPDAAGRELHRSGDQADLTGDEDDAVDLAGKKKRERLQYLTLKRFGGSRCKFHCCGI